MTVRLEHANLRVQNIEGMVRFLRAAFPEFRIRGQGKNMSGRRWVHVGTDETYLALNEVPAERPEGWAPYSSHLGLSHLGYEVADAEAVRRRLLTAGYRESTVPNQHPYRKRVYFYDAEGNDWEFVEYRSEDPAKRNDYELPDLT